MPSLQKQQRWRTRGEPTRVDTHFRRKGVGASRRGIPHRERPPPLALRAFASLRPSQEHAQKPSPRSPFLRKGEEKRLHSLRSSCGRGRRSGDLPLHVLHPLRNEGGRVPQACGGMPARSATSHPPRSPFLRKGEEKRGSAAAHSSPPSERRGSCAGGTRGDAGTNCEKSNAARVPASLHPSEKRMRGNRANAIPSPASTATRWRS
jgi:hypothetical protein